MASKNWFNTQVNLGSITEGKTVNFKYTSNFNLEGAIFKPGCRSCTKILGYKNNILNVSFTADKIPYHIEGRYVVTKFIDVEYLGQNERLYFSAIITKK